MRLLRGSELRAQRRSLPQTDVEAHDPTGVRMDAKNRGLAFDFRGLRIGIDVPFLRDKLVDHKNDMLRCDVPDDVFLFCDSDQVAAELVADDGLLHMFRVGNTLQMADHRVCAQMQIGRASCRERV